MFRVPSSTPPSTPDSYRRSHVAPSTTPAGPPPDRSLISSTPAGPPPPRSNLFGGSRPSFEPGRYNNPTESLFGSSPPKNGILEGIGSSDMRTSTSGRPASQRGRTSSSGFNRIPSSPPRTTREDVEDEEDEEDEDMEDDEEDAEGDEDEDEDMEDSDEDEQIGLQRRPRPQDNFSHSVASRASVEESFAGPTVVRKGSKQQHYDLVNLAKGLTPHTESAKMTESDEVILETEFLMKRLNDSLDNDAPGTRAEVLGDIAHELLVLWQTSLQSPDDEAPSKLPNASKLAELLLGIHHPSRIVSQERTFASSRALTLHGQEPFTPIPKVLLNWLNEHRSVDEEFDIVLRETGGYSRHGYFWDIVHASALRGQFAKTLDLLTGANFAVASTAEEDVGASGYSGHHLEYATLATQGAINLLRECPGHVSDDWDLKGHDWSIFRQRAHQSWGDLKELAEGDSKSRFSMSQSFQTPLFGLSQSHATFNLSLASRKAESKVPWLVYNNLEKLYQILLGNEEDILAVSADWMEATILLTVWWDGEEEDHAQGSLAASRRALARSQRVRTVDVKAYTERLTAALAAVLDTGDDQLLINTTNHFEIGVACILDDNIEGALRMLRGSSLVVASAVAEVATAGEWFMRADGILGQLDQSDLLLLSYTEQHKSGLSKDELLAAYAKQLTLKGYLANQDGSTSREGWELAIEVLGRLDDTALANERIQQILDELPSRVIGTRLSDQALGIALKFAEHLHKNTQNYGDAILYYARAHAASKIQEVLRVLVAHCLVKSVAYPPLAELDNSLRELITYPKKTLTKLASFDSEAAQLLSNSLSGYATIRKFYDLRDEEVLLQNGDKPAHRPMARKRTAANALTVIISSAASSIRGGLYDPDVETVVQVDVLLPLLGEVLVFVNQPKRTLTLRHLYDLLAAVEDLSTAPSMIRTQCEEALRTTLAAAHEHASPNSVDLGSVEGVSTESSTVLVKGGGVDDVKRGWDWRKGFPRGAKGEDVIRVLRLGIAKELGRAFAEGEVVP
ncbi:hypothetical protein N0V90_009223 [Kalmusia sp. IMI 367209]|nr:hypothetical protein N0V90_009223 [Kalmusia sp. IMI 367209]